MSVFVEIILVYLLYRFIAGFLVPLYRTTTSMRQQFRNMNGHPGAGEQNSPNAKGSNGPDVKPQPPKSGTGKAGEYIDFEEIK